MLAPRETDPIAFEEFEAGEGTIEERALTRWRQFVYRNGKAMAELKADGARLQEMVSPAGKQFPQQIQDLFTELGLPMLSLNEMWPAIANLSGREQTSRQVPKISGRSTFDQGFADSCNAAVAGMRELRDLEMAVANAYRNAHIGAVSAVHYRIRRSRRTPFVEAEKVPLFELMLPLDDQSPNYERSLDIGRGQWYSLAELKRDWPEHSSYWKELKESQDFDWGGDGDVWAWSLGIDTVETGSDYGRSWPNEGGGWTVQCYDRRTDRAFLVTHQFAERERVYSVRLAGEVVQMWAAATVSPSEPEGQELPYEGDYDLPVPPGIEQQMTGLAAIGEELGGGRTTVETIGFLARRAEELVAQQRMQARQMEFEAQQQGMEPPEPYQPLPEVFRDFTPEEFIAFKRGYLMAGGGPVTDFFDVEREVWYQAFYAGRRVLEVRKLEHGMPTLLPLVCYAEEKQDRQVPRSTAAVMCDPQMWRNAIANAYAYAFAVMTKAQLLGHRGMLDPDEVAEIEESITLGSPVVWMSNPDALREFPGSGRQIPAGVDQALAMTENIVAKAIGQTNATLGTLGTVSRTAHRLVTAQTEMAQATVAEAQDHLRAFRKRETRLLLAIIFTYFSREDFEDAAGEDYAQYIPADREMWFRALDWSLIADEEPKSRHASMALLELIGNSVLGNRVPDKALAELAAPAVGSNALAAWKEELEAASADKALQLVAEQFGMKPEDVTQVLQQMSQPQEQ